MYILKNDFREINKKDEKKPENKKRNFLPKLNLGIT